jgi:mevalonyl-CoA ligase
MPSLAFPPVLKEPSNNLAAVEQNRRLSVIRGPSHPPLMNITLGDLTRRQSQKHGARAAVISQHQDEVITYLQLHEHSDHLAAGMIAAGVKKGDRIAVLLGNRSEYVHVRMSLSLAAPLIKVEEN